MENTQILTGKPVSGNEGTRTVNMQNLGSMYWVFTPQTTGKNLYVSGDTAQPDPTAEVRHLLHHP
jgi:hypothetical protein